MFPGINELLITLVLIVAIGVATRFFGDSAKNKAESVKDAAKGTMRKSSGAKPLKRDPETGVYEPEEGSSDRSPD